MQSSLAASIAVALIRSSRRRASTRARGCPVTCAHGIGAPSLSPRSVPQASSGGSLSVPLARAGGREPRRGCRGAPGQRHPQALTWRFHFAKARAAGGTESARWEVALVRGPGDPVRCRAVPPGNKRGPHRDLCSPPHTTARPRDSPRASTCPRPPFPLNSRACRALSSCARRPPPRSSTGESSNRIELDPLLSDSGACGCGTARR